jgi:hypothetical protein
MNIRIVSGADRLLFRSDDNHRYYAGLHGYDYRFDTTHYTNLSTPHFRKLYSVQSALDGSEWVFWLDDDAFFTNMSMRLETFLNDLPAETFLVICASPANPKGGWTFLSSGQFFLKNDQRGRDFLHKVLATPIETARAWWDPDRYGIFTNGDQDSIVYTLVNEKLLQFTKVYPYTAFNSRPHHYNRQLGEHFLIHFAGVPDKQVAITDFALCFGLDETLVQHHEMKTEESANGGGYAQRLRRKLITRWCELMHWHVSRGRQLPYDRH